MRSRDKLFKAFGDVQRGAKTGVIADMITRAVAFNEDERAQGSIMGFYVQIALAVILGLQFALPVVDSAVNTNTSAYNNLTPTAKTLAQNFGLFIILGLAVMILRPAMG